MQPGGTLACSDEPRCKEFQLPIVAYYRNGEMMHAIPPTELAPENLKNSSREENERFVKEYIEKNIKDHLR